MAMIPNIEKQSSRSANAGRSLVVVMCSCYT
jgi:hypothetical protein